jgi:rhodanese-related sulfurtransferase
VKKTIAIAFAFLMSATLASAQMKVTKPAPGTRPATPLSATGAQAQNPTNFPRISREDAKKLIDSNQAVLIDVRSNEQFSYGHIKGALSIPGSQLMGRFREVPPGKTIITYCACHAEESAGRAASSLIAHGVKNVFALKGGWTEWKGAGLPTAVGPK